MGPVGRKRGQTADREQGTRLCPPVGTPEPRQELSEMGIKVARSKTCGRFCAQSWEVRPRRRHSPVLEETPV